ncbi:MAG TPA: N-acetyl sugar amidotransferase [Puia sp.]|jgi:N-acetyl sugar amidotransferase
MKVYNESVLKKDPSFNNNRPWQQCSISVMDTISDPDIRFDANGVSNYYYQYQAIEKDWVFTGKEGEQKLAEWVDRIKASGAGKKYDCITGVSGGVDSTYLVLMAKKLGLRPLIVHFDNGWNSELATKNIENIISKLGFDLYTLVVDWQEFRDLQLSYLKASVVDIEALTDHAIMGTLYRLAAMNDIKYILSGTNVVTEAILPRHWIWNKSDHENIKDIHKKFGKVPLKTYPLFTARQKRFDLVRKGIETAALLNYVPYNKTEVKATITAELDWRDYGGKHYESIFTRFYQGYILPVKFGIDKRKAHLSNLIFSGQITQEQALEELKSPAYDPAQLKEDYEFVLKKFNLSEEEFDRIMSVPRKEHSDYKTEMSIYEKYPWTKGLKPVGDIVKKIF